MQRFRPLRRALGVALAAAIAVTPAAVAAPVQAAAISFDDPSVDSFDDLLSISVKRLEFGTIPFGSPGVTMSYTITALADVDLGWANWHAPGPDKPWGQVTSGGCAEISDQSGLVRMTAGSVCTIDTTFTPNTRLGLHIPYYAANTWIASRDGVDHGARLVPLTASVAGLDIETAELELTAMPGEQSQAVRTTLTNNAAVRVDQVTLTGLAEPFSLASSTCDVGIDVGGSCELNFAYRGGADSSVDTQGVGLIFAATGPNGQETYDSRGNPIFQLTGTTLETADLSVTKQFLGSDPLGLGNTAQWQVDVTNHGPTLEPSVTLTDVLYPGLDYDQPWCPIDDTWKEDGFTYGTCEFGPLDVGETRTFTISSVVTAEASGILLAGGSWVRGSLPDPNPDNDDAYAFAGLTVAPVDPPVGPGIDPQNPAPDNGTPEGAHQPDGVPAAGIGSGAASAETLAQSGVDDPRIVLLVACALLSGGIVLLIMWRRSSATLAGDARNAQEP